MRIRTIKPEFWTSTTIAELPDDSDRLLFIGLWNYVDDEGRGKDEERLIKAAIFPLNDRIEPYMVDAMLWILASSGLITRYEVDGKRYLAITHWSEHQTISHPRPSVIPPPDDGNGRRNTTYMLPEPSGLEGKGSGREQGREGNGLEAAARTVDNNPNQPSHDQLYLADKLDLSVPAVVKLNKRFGRQVVSDSMRHLHGFPPEDGVESVYAYLLTLCDLKAVAS